MVQLNYLPVKITSLLLVSVAGFGCASYQPTPTSDTFTAFGNPTAKAVRSVEKSAPFELDCDAQELTYKELAPQKIGVNGCSRRVVYVFVQGVGWVVNSSLD